MVTGDGHAASNAASNSDAASNVALVHPDLAGIHFSRSTATLQRLLRSVGSNISCYGGYPRLVGETGGKDFIAAHPSADPDERVTAMIRGAFEHQGQIGHGPDFRCARQ